MTHSYSSSSSTDNCKGKKDHFQNRSIGLLLGHAGGYERTVEHKPSQTQTLLSRLHVASRFPEGAHATHFTSFSCPSSTVRLCEMSKQSSEDTCHGLQTFLLMRRNIQSDLKIIILLFPDACGGIKAGRGQVVPTGRPCHFPDRTLVSILKDRLTDPRVT